MRRLKGNVVLEGLYYLHSVALILINSFLMLEAPCPVQRELHTLELHRAPRTQSTGHNRKVILVAVKKWDGRNKKEDKGVKNTSIYYLLDLFQLASAMVHAVCSEVLFWVVTLVHLNGVEFGVLKIVTVMQIEPLLCVRHDDFPSPEGPSEAARLFDFWGRTDCNFAIYTCSVTLKNQPFGWHETHISHSYQLVQCKFWDSLSWRDLWRWQQQLKLYQFFLDF